MTKNTQQSREEAFFSAYESMVEKTANGPENTFLGVSKGMQACAGAPDVERLAIPAVFSGLFEPHRYKVFYGGRGGGKSWAMADALLTLMRGRRLRVLCARELQRSIRDSVHRLLRDRIIARNLGGEFQVLDTCIRHESGGEILFAGLRHNVAELKSFEGVDICWVEEGQKVSQESWDILLPTIRKEGSEIWISMNPDGPNDPTWTEFVLSPKPDSVVRKVLYCDNPWFPDTLEKERAECERRDPDKYRWIWLGEPRVNREAQVFCNRWRVEAFDEFPARWRYGCDWGFGPDPSVLVRAALRRDPATGAQEIYVSHEAWAKGLEITQLPALLRQVPDVARSVVVADSARPELIRYMRRQRFAIKPAKKWAGSIEDGLDVLKGYGLVVHPRCTHLIEELTRYSYKVDPLTGEIGRAVVDRDNHLIDSLRYAFDDVIRNRGTV